MLTSFPLSLALSVSSIATPREEQLACMHTSGHWDGERGKWDELDRVQCPEIKLKLAEVQQLVLFTQKQNPKEDLLGCLFINDKEASQAGVRART